jgi:hypothetical protein
VNNNEQQRKRGKRRKLRTLDMELGRGTRPSGKQRRQRTVAAGNWLLDEIRASMLGWLGARAERDMAQDM